MHHSLLTHLFTSKESSAIVAWQLLWSNIQTRLHPSPFGYLNSAIYIAFFICWMNLLQVQYLFILKFPLVEIDQLVDFWLIPPGWNISIRSSHQKKYKTTIPEPLLLGFITTEPFIPQKVNWSFAWKVLHHGKDHCLIQHLLWWTVCKSLGRLYLALSVEALLRKPRPTIFHKNLFHDCTTSSRSWPSTKHPFCLNPSSCNQC